MLSAAERDQLQKWSRRPKSAPALALRARIILACAQSGATNKQVAADLRMMEHTVAGWRGRFVDNRLELDLGVARDILIACCDGVTGSGVSPGQERNVLWVVTIGGVIVVKGASRGIGRDIAVRVAADGARVALPAKTETPHPKITGPLVVGRRGNLHAKLYQPRADRLDTPPQTIRALAAALMISDESTD